MSKDSTTKRLLVLNYEFPPVGGGGGVASKKIAAEFVRRGWQVDVISSGFPGVPRKQTVEGIRVYRVPVIGRKHQTHSSMLALFTYVVSAFFFGMLLCLRHRYSYMHTHFAVPTGPLGVVLSRLFGISHTLSIHGGDIYDPSKKSAPQRHWWLRKVVRYVMSHADHVVAQSVDTKKNAEHIYNPRTPIDIIPLPHETIVFSQKTRKELDLDPTHIYLVSVGRLIRRKGFDDIARALSILPDHVHALIIGEGPERDFLQRVANEEGVADRFHLLGYVSEEEKMQYLSVADIYILSSWHEGFGIVVQEAMQVGLPLIATNQGGQVDLIEQDVNGLLIRPHDSQELVKAISQLMEDSALRDTMKTENVKKLQEYTAAKVVDQYESVMTQAHHE